tara:strand:- start:662 stop:766 length:105 start_codon:yes stop_codon:yes gene_type:complete
MDDKLSKNQFDVAVEQFNRAADIEGNISTDFLSS